jgi:aminoglycoside 3-N-acetyltransferase
MSHWEKERAVIERSDYPVTEGVLGTGLSSLGLEEGDVLLFHGSLSSLGWVVGGSVTVIDALMGAVGPEGTIVMPRFTTGNAEPSGWRYPSVPESWWETIRQEMPSFDIVTTPVRGMGVIPEVFRKYPGVLRSNHPQLSFTAYGGRAQKIIEEQPLETPFGEEGPLGKLYRLSAKILLLGVDHSVNTSLHLSEELASLKGHPAEAQGAAVVEDGTRVWRTWEQIEYDSCVFGEIGTAFDEEASIKPEKIGLAECRLLDMRSLVDFGVRWLEENRKY